MSYEKIKNAFTLAEVLITIAIIGIVASLVIPVTVQKYQEKARVTATQKFYSTITQAVNLAILENGSPDTWNIKLSDSSAMLTKIMPYLAYTQYCDYKNKELCVSAKFILLRNGEKSTGYLPMDSSRSILRLNNGMLVGTFAQSADCSAVFAGGKNTSNICGEYMVDVNGESAPNTYGKDIFMFNLTKYGVIPTGSREFDNTIEQIPDENNRFNVVNYPFDTGCLSKDANGFGCAGWVIENGNMDYWHCDDLSWDGKQKC